MNRYDLYEVVTPSWDHWESFPAGIWGGGACEYREHSGCNMQTMSTTNFALEQSDSAPKVMSQPESTLQAG